MCHIPVQQVCSAAVLSFEGVLIYFLHCLRWSCSIRCLLCLFHVPSQPPERKCVTLRQRERYHETRRQFRGMIWVMLPYGIVPYSLEKRRIVVRRAPSSLPKVKQCVSSVAGMSSFSSPPLLVSILL